MTITVLPAEDFVQIESIEIDESKFKFIPSHGDVSTIKVNIYPENATVTDLVFDTIHEDMLKLTPNGTSVDVEAIGGVGDAYVTITSKSNPSLYKEVKVWVFLNAHPNPSSLTYIAGEVAIKANTEWGWFQTTISSLTDVTPLDYGARFTKSLGTSMEYDKVIFGNSAKYYDDMCGAGFEDACIGIDTFVQMFKFTDEANEGLYRLLAEFAGDDLTLTDAEGFTGGSYYYNHRWFHWGYLDFGLTLLISGQE